jgi:hypothetical protein
MRDRRAEYRANFVDSIGRLVDCRRIPALVPALDILVSDIARIGVDALFDEIVPEGARGGKKYLDLTGCIASNHTTVRALRLHRSPPLSILDLGCGSGVFCFVAKAFGHMAIGLERSRVKRRINYAGLHRLDGVTVSTQEIAPMQQIRRDDVLANHRFDLINGAAIMFNVWKSELWDAESYLFLLRDLRDNFLNEGGRIILRFNVRLWGESVAPRSDVGLGYYAELGRLLEPFAVDPQPGNLVEIDPFRCPLDSDVVLPKMRLRETRSQDEDGEDETD